MNRQGQRPLSNVTNMNPPNNQPRSTARAQPSKPTIWGQPGLQTQSNTSSRDASIPEGSWAQQAQQLAGTRSTQPLDFSSSSFPSLNNGAGGPSQAANAGASSAWQGGPPQQNETTRRGQQMGGSRPLGSRQAPGPGPTADFFPADSRSAATMSNGPPGLPGIAQRQPTLNDSSDPSRVTSPSVAMHQDSRSPIGQHLNGAIGADRPQQQQPQQLNDSSPASAQQPQPRGDPFAQSQQQPLPSTTSFEPQPPSSTTDQTPSALLSHLSEKDKWGMKGYLTLADGPSPTFRSLFRGQDLSGLGVNMSSPTPSLLNSYHGPFAVPSLHTSAPLRPLDGDFMTPECYTVKKVAPLNTRINCFSDETLFYMFYSMPRDYIQILVAQELMERKWRYHVGEQMWMMRDEGGAPGSNNAQGGQSGGYQSLEGGLSEQGYYIWWDKGLWKKVRRAYTLRYADLDDLPGGGQGAVPPGVAGAGRGAGGAMRGGAAGLNGGGVPQQGTQGGGAFNAVPGLEKLAAASTNQSGDGSRF